MARRSPLGSDPPATIVFAGTALVASAALLGAATMDGGTGVVGIAVGLTPLAVIAAYVAWNLRDDDVEPDAERIAVAVLTAQADDPTLSGDDPVSRAAAELLSAITVEERTQARRRLAEELRRIEPA